MIQSRRTRVQRKNYIEIGKSIYVRTTYKDLYALPANKVQYTQDIVCHEQMQKQVERQ